MALLGRLAAAAAAAPMLRPPAAATAALLLPLLVALLCFSAPLCASEAADVDAEEASLLDPVLTTEVGDDVTVFLQTALITAHRSASAAAASKPSVGGPAVSEETASTAAAAPCDAARASVAQAADAEAASRAASVASAETLLKPSEVVQTMATPKAVEFAEGEGTAAIDGPVEALAGPVSPSQPLPSGGSSSSNNLGVRLFGGPLAHPATPAERQKKELAVLLAASVVLQVLLLKISSRMSENSGGKQSIDDIIMRTDFNQG